MSVLRHLQVLKDAWSAENARAHEGRRRWTATEFLPAALEVVETPPSPIGRMMIWVIVLAAATALAWACLSTVDVVAVAEGRLVSAGRLRSVESAEAGVVRAILVRESHRDCTQHIFVPPSRSGEAAILMLLRRACVNQPDRKTGIDRKPIA